MVEKPRNAIVRYEGSVPKLCHSSKKNCIFATIANLQTLKMKGSLSR